MATSDLEPAASEAPLRKPLSEAARRALAEAQARRDAALVAAEAPAEVNGRKGPEPVRYGDWEKNGLAIDF